MSVDIIIKFIDERSKTPKVYIQRFYQCIVLASLPEKSELKGSRWGKVGKGTLERKPKRLFGYADDDAKIG